MALLDFLIEVIGYTMARLTLPLLSFGRIHVEPLGGPWKEFNVFGYRYDDDGRIEIEARSAGLVGIVVCFVAFGIGLLFGVAA
ncbi:hypothetical protein [Bradyrhizobium paxllaeri]|uniref:hypothetical protein n=1 Tax=Bradyrhizobium paxllaeri TaxID=190148 RepID=UPI000810C7BE|nr:hypothetical protein [Bradyrhizobium paxllaeri]